MLDRGGRFLISPPVGGFIPSVSEEPSPALQDELTEGNLNLKLLDFVVITIGVQKFTKSFRIPRIRNEESLIKKLK